MFLKFLFWVFVFGYLGWQAYKFYRKIAQKYQNMKQVFTQNFTKNPPPKDEIMSKEFGDITVHWRKNNKKI